MIFLIGKESRYILEKINIGTSVKWFENLEELQEAFSDLINSQTPKAFYIKGSRANKLDVLLNSIKG